MRSFWQPVRRSEDLPRGQAQPLTIMSEQFTLYRGASGRPVVMAPGCAHRQTALSVGTVEDDGIRCMFHGWKFGPDGKCTQAPGQGDSLPGRVSVRAYPAREEFGLIFAYLGDGAVPEFPDIAAFSRARGRDLASAPLIENNAYRRDCNYYINVENTLDLAHVPFTHRLSSDPARTKVGFSPDVAVLRDITVERTEFGVAVTEDAGAETATRAAVLLPNAMHLLVGQRDGVMEQVAWRVPADDDSHWSFSITALHASGEGVRRYRERSAGLAAGAAGFPATGECARQVLRGEKRLSDFTGHPQLVNIEDHVAQMGMRFIADPGKEHLGPADKGVVQVRRMYLQRLTAFLSGSPAAARTW
ncbi:MAG TPA: Rieske 2Fe-2S domain-containing protein [Trebonia sp.]|nr:Rieske 2Fe-2S domain-containing protein [Trebonia sp.]